MSLTVAWIALLAGAAPDPLVAWKKAAGGAAWNSVRTLHVGVRPADSTPGLRAVRS